MRWIALVVSAALSLSSMASRAQLYDPNLEVYAPFHAEIAREHFKSCYPETTEEQLDALSRIGYWGYAFFEHTGCPPGVNCNPNVTFFRLHRRISIDASEANPPHVFSQIRSAERQSCTSPREMNNLQASISKKKAEYTFQARQRSRVCPPWGGSWTVAEGTADIRIGYRLGDDLSLTPYKEITNERGRLLGFLDGSLAQSIIMLAFGHLSAVIPIVAIELARKDLIDRLRSNDFLGAGVNLAQNVVKGPVEDLGELGPYAIEFQIDIPNTGFERTGSQVNLIVHQDGYRPTYLREHFLDIRRTEIDFLKSLSEVGPAQYHVRTGDSWWSITKEHYKDPRLFIMIAEYNQRAPDMLRVGETVQLPRWYELCQKLKPNKLFVRDGQTLWEKRQLGDIPSAASVTTRSGNPNLIYPYEELKVQPPAH
ncbi:hypothetical protein CN172_20490 [Sinorhizobium meliloti]|uniref:LysM peptidoglycan-binding domain-containing protein n=1 Tax=Rhizobium meliloti TaxID=382 RepID=UPI000FDB9E32|nr:hypothetical protein [Sinorhizobium meliloti]RVE96408.1 hypothetical protein CN232_24050 [Sinorhizobium meliloti]RVH47478.1 hypothetical protein CN208_04710 [Sinorhizobium meliloti]RVK11117.1 hypothetical protein CN172_20490 [Sinorhizobium meliloti]